MFRLRPLLVIFFVAVALCLLGFWRVRSQTSTLRRVTITTDEGINLNPSLSGDGRRISFESTEDLAHSGGSESFRAIRADLSSDPAAFTQMAATRAPAPGISHDGSRVGFASKDDPLGTNSDGNSEVFLYDGAALRQITNTSPTDTSTRTSDGNFQPSLTEDGRFIAFSSNRNLTNQNPDGNLEIFVFDTSANTFTQLTDTAGTVGATDAKISGDGSRVAYIRDNGASRSTQRDLILQDRVAGTVHVLASNITNLAFTYGRAISDDGLRVVYSADVATESSQVFLFDGRVVNSSRQITSLGARTTEVPLHPTISPDGTRIAFATRRPVTGLSNGDASIELYIYDIPTASFSRVTNGPSTADGFSGSTRVAEVVSSLNDDGSIVAFNFPRVLSGAVTTGTENNSEIYVAATTARPTVGALKVLNGASFGNEPSTIKAVTPNSIAVAQGGALSFTTVQAQKQSDGSFPTTLGRTTVTVNNRAAQIFFVSPTQVNFLVPPQTETGTATVTVTNSEGFQSRGTVAILRAAPGIFTYSGDGLGEAVVLTADTLQPGPFDPTKGNLRLIIFTTGVRGALSQVTATAGGRALTVESFAASPDMAGMDEVHVLVPSDLRGAGPVSLVVRADGRDSNATLITFSGNSCRDIVINEVLADPPDGDAGDANLDGVRNSNDDEFVELVNTTANNIDIGGHQLLTRSSSSTTDTVRHTFPSGTLFPAGSAIVVFGGGNFNPNNPAFGGAQVFRASSGGLSLTNSGGVVTVRTPTQEIVNIFSYGGSTGLDGDANQSLTRSPDAGGATCGNFVPHRTAPGSNGRAFSPGTRADGSPFAAGVGRLSGVTISPASASVTRGRAAQFTAQAKDQFNRPMTGVAITFASDQAGVATVDSFSTDPAKGIATATLTGRGAGTAHVTAQATDGATTVNSDQATLTVNEPLPVVMRVEVSPSSPTINRGQTQQFSATAFDQNNGPISGASFTWSSGNTDVATINASGVATGVGLGSTTITAST
ncbi:MAG: Ig-like domain-containing protein, partial [Acidobacteriota bacterium]|nr:Ig-like domain-containing protein [Acidobacteriota bacterium]